MPSAPDIFDARWRLSLNRTLAAELLSLALERHAAERAVLEADLARIEAEIAEAGGTE